MDDDVVSRVKAFADPAGIHVIAPNLKRRLSGVTSTIVQLIPEQNRLGQKVAVLGPGLPPHLPHLRLRDLYKLWQRPQGCRFRIWHARRNTEMLAGLILRDILRMPLKLVFTSAAQRHHSGYTRWLIRKMDRVVATSARSGSFLEVPHTVIMHGIDLSAFHPASGDEKEQVGADPPGQYLVGCFGRVRHQKGTDLFVKAMIKLFPRYPQWTAVISGRVTAEHQKFTDELKSEIANAGLSDRIVFIGEVDDIKPWYRRLTLYVAPSRNEGFGLTPLEAMASATPAVTSDAGAYAEMTEPGTTGITVPAGDGYALEKAIEAYLKSPEKAEAEGKAGREHVEEHFALNREASALGHIYVQLSSSDNSQT